MLCQEFFASSTRLGLIVAGSLVFGVACGGTTTGSSGAPITGATGGASGGGGDSASGGSASSTGGSGGHTSPTGAPASHRATADACSHNRGAIVASPEAGASLGSDASASCVSDRDCTAGVNGRCEQLADGLRYPTSFCTYDECFTDGDCRGAFAACVCGDAFSSGFNPATSRGPNTCVTGNCRIDADCGVHGYCSLTVDQGPCSVVSTPVGLYCHTPQDDCTADSDCTQPLTGCAYSTALGKWTCTAQGGCNG